uniref:Link domain-containing protein n=1 Tax=viral metagenome TaxID=1070528 RepID=A0A6C0L841_9ZZZZ
MDYSQLIPPNYNVNEQFETTGKNKQYDVYDDPNTFEGFFYAIFNKSNIIMILWFLAIYFIAYYLLGFVFNKAEPVVNYQLNISRTIDIIALLCVLTALFGYGGLSSDDQIKYAEDTTEYFKKDMTSFGAIIVQMISITIFYAIVFVFRVPMERDNKPITVSIIETSMWLYLIIQLFSVFFKYALGASLYDVLSNYYNWDKLPDYAPVPSKPVELSRTTGNVKAYGNVSLVGNVSFSQPTQKDEVFNISNNLYTYDDAQAICKAYGAKLANYDEIEDSYKKGAEWCNYGWSANQMAFFPTQKSTWSALQETDNNKNDCGRPGVNGGFFGNPYLKFGVNCFGKKPKASDDELARMKQLNDKIYPKKPKDSVIDRKVEFWKENADKMLVLNSFNKNDWSEF